MVSRFRSICRLLASRCLCSYSLSFDWPTRSSSTKVLNWSFISSPCLHLSSLCLASFSCSSNCSLSFLIAFSSWSWASLSYVTSSLSFLSSLSSSTCSSFSCMVLFLASMTFLSAITSLFLTIFSSSFYWFWRFVMDLSFLSTLFFRRFIFCVSCCAFYFSLSSWSFQPFASYSWFFSSSMVVCCSEFFFVSSTVRSSSSASWSSRYSSRVVSWASLSQFSSSLPGFSSFFGSCLNGCATDMGSL